MLIKDIHTFLTKHIYTLTSIIDELKLLFAAPRPQENASIFTSPYLFDHVKLQFDIMIHAEHKEMEPTASSKLS